MTDLWGVVVPVLIAVTLSVAGAAVVSRSAASPAQTAYIQALQGRLAVVEEERDDAQQAIPQLEARISALEDTVHKLKDELAERDREIARLYRRLEADEKRIGR